MHEAQSLINHVALVLDGSGSMRRHKNRVIEVTDGLVRDLATASEEKRQETRVSIYVFDERVECVIFDMDVMRLPSVKDLYWVGGLTALVDATMRSQEDLDTTSQIYGQHAFLTYVVTDGGENASGRTATNSLGGHRRFMVHDLAYRLNHSPANSTIAFLVPDRQGVDFVTNLGAAPGNVMQWDTASEKGMLDVGASISRATRTFMDNRVTGTHSSRTIFDTSAAAVNAATVQATLAPLDPRSYGFVTAEGVVEIRDLVEAGYGVTYRKGIAFYHLIKSEMIQPQKQVIVVEKGTGRAFGGDQARALIGLPDMPVKVSPSGNPKYDVFVQSTSTNRKILDGQKVLVRV